MDNSTFLTQGAGNKEHSEGYVLQDNHAHSRVDAIELMDPSEDGVRMTTRLHFKQREMKDMDIRLAQVKEDVDIRMTTVKQREQQFLAKKAETVENLARFRYFVEESDQKRQRAERNAAEERATIRSEEQEILRLEDKLLSLHKESKSKQMELQKYILHKQYLMQVVTESRNQQSEVYSDPKDITTRHKLLISTNSDLHEQSQLLAQETTNCHYKMQLMLKDKLTSIQLKQSQLAKLMKDLDDVKIEGKVLINDINLLEVRDNENRRIFTTIDNVIRNIEQRSQNFPTTIRLKREKIQEGDTVPYLLKLLSIIGEKVVMMKEVYEAVTNTQLNVQLIGTSRYGAKKRNKKKSKKGTKYNRKYLNNTNNKPYRYNNSGLLSRPSSSQSMRSTATSASIPPYKPYNNNHHHYNVIANNTTNNLDSLKEETPIELAQAAAIDKIINKQTNTTTLNRKQRSSQRPSTTIPRRRIASSSTTTSSNRNKLQYHPPGRLSSRLSKVMNDVNDNQGKLSGRQSILDTHNDYKNNEFIIPKRLTVGNW